MTKLFVVVRGGTSHEKDHSREYGLRILEVLRSINKNTKDLYLHPNGMFTLDGIPVDLSTTFPKFNFVWNALVGVDGENGTISELCEKHGVSFVGHKAMHAHLVQDKYNFKKAITQHGLKSPYGVKLSKTGGVKSESLKAFGTVGIPAIVKPVADSGLNQVTLASSYSELEYGVSKIFEAGKDVLVEKFKKGVSGSVFVYKKYDIYNAHVAHHPGVTAEGEQIIKDNFIDIRNQILSLHHALGFSDHVEYDFVYTPKGVYVLEANTHPSLVHGYIDKIFSEDDGKELQNYVQYKLIERGVI